MYNLSLLDTLQHRWQKYHPQVKEMLKERAQALGLVLHPIE
jgi:hypothetical protein